MAKNNLFPAVDVQYWHKDSYLLQRRILWLMGGRLIIVTLLLGSTVLFQLRNLSETSTSYPFGNMVFWLVGGTYFVTLLYSFFFPKIRHFSLFAYVQLFGDLLLVSLLVLLTGCQESIFLFCYLLVIIAAAILLFRRGALFFASLSFGLVLVLMLSSILGWIQHLEMLQTIPKTPTLPEAAYISVIYGSAFYMIAILASHLSETVRETGQILKKQQIDLDNLEVFHQDIIRSLASGLITTDTRRHIQFLNQSARELLGVTWSDCHGKHLSSLFKQLDEGLFEKNQYPSRLELLYQKEDELLNLGLSFSPLRDHHRQDIGTLVLFQNLTELKKMEEMAKRNEKLAALGELAAGLAHEIRNPLAALSGSIQLMSCEESLDDEQRALMGIVERETERVNRLLSDFLLFARPKSLVKEEHHCAELLKQTLMLFAQDPISSSIQIEKKMSDSLIICVDPFHFHQIIWNLLLNAAQVIYPKEGRIEISAEKTDSGVWISILDDGPGIDPKEQKKIFDPFFSTKERGTGLGLSVVQRIVIEHNGEIELLSELEKFACFRLFFPHSEKQVVKQPSV